MKKLNITIPEPCHEDWNAMDTTQKGKFCNSCTKEVFDFTTYSDEQLIKRFTKEGNLCGRFTTTQLNRDLVLQRKNSHNYLSYIFSGLFSLFLLSSSSSKAQEKPKTIQTDKKFTSIPLENARVTDSITITGTVLDETDMPLPGATVQIKGATTGTSTDIDGKYTIKANTGDTLMFSYVGYSEQNTIVVLSNTIDIALAPDTTSEEVIITGGIHIKQRWIGGNIFTRFINIFRKNNKNPKYRF